MDEKIEIKKLYTFLCGIEKSVSEARESRYVSDMLCFNYNQILQMLIDIINDESLKLFKIAPEEHKERNLTIGEMENHICPVIEYLKNFYIEDGEHQITKVGYLYNSIEDSDIKSRCGDILLGEGPFDRAINQATQILEDRIKKKAELKNTPLIGIQLISKAVHPKLDETILKFSDKPDIQEGYSFLLKGIMSNYRNTTHHSLSFDCNREYALKICAYIDELLKIVEKSEKVK